jgi:hypothetical protein
VVVIWDNLNTRVSAEMAELIEAWGWLTVCQRRPDLLEGFLASTGLDLTPFCDPHH